MPQVSLTEAPIGRCAYTNKREIHGPSELHGRPWNHRTIMNKEEDIRSGRGPFGIPLSQKAGQLSSVTTVPELFIAKGGLSLSLSVCVCVRERVGVGWRARRLVIVSIVPLLTVDISSGHGAGIGSCWNLCVSVCVLLCAYRWVRVRVCVCVCGQTMVWNYFMIGSQIFITFCEYSF